MKTAFKRINLLCDVELKFNEVNVNVLFHASVTLFPSPSLRLQFENNFSK